MTRRRAGLLGLVALLAIGIWLVRTLAPAPAPELDLRPETIEPTEAPLPQPEIFVPRDGLKVSLLTDTPVITLGDSLRFTLRFQNEGTEPLLILPRQPWPAPLSWSDPPVRLPDQFQFDAFRRAVTRADLVALAPGEAWEMPLPSPTYDPPQLRPGVHDVGVTYVNYPDYWFEHYDPYSMPPNTWEGMAVAERVRITVTPPRPDAVARWMESLGSDLPEYLPLELLALSGPEGVAALIDHIRTTAGSGGGHLAIQALAAAEPVPVQDVIDALDAAGPRGRERLQDVVRFLLPSQSGIDCTLLDRLFTRLVNLPGSYRDLFAPGIAACPSIAASLRATLVDPAQPHTTRANAATLLGFYRDASDIPLLIDALEGRLAAESTLWPNDPVVIRHGAAAGLAGFRIRDPDVLGALIRVLADSRQNRWLRTAAAGALAGMGDPAAVPPLIDLLSSPDPELVVSAVTNLERLQASEAVPRLIELLRHRNPRLRMEAARALRTLGDPAAREAMAAVLDDADSYVRMHALSYLADLAEHGDTALRDSAMDALQARESHVRYGAIDVLARFGTEADVVRVRQLLDVADDPYVHGSLMLALSRLTFVAAFDSRRVAEWDAWYEQHRDATRVEWAIDALERLEEAPFPVLFNGLWPAQMALPYLADLGDGRAIDAIERAADSRWWGVRVEAAHALATSDRPKAMRLLIREFTGRSYEACVMAHGTLNRLVGERREIDCHDPDARAAAAAEWTAVVR